MDTERYEITQLIGKGRTGGVYTANDNVLSRKVAVRRFFSAQGDSNTESWQEEFTNIAQNLCNLQHPNLLTVFDAGVDSDGAFMIAQLLDGTPLPEHLQKNTLSEWDVHEMANQILDAFTAAHAAGFVHGALTPGSVMISPRARGGFRYMLTDLGLARLAPLIQGAGSALGMMADPALMAPELFEGKPADEQSDCYMLGHLLYLCLAGGHPFGGQDIETAAKSHSEGAMPPLTKYRSDISPEFAEWIHKLIQPDPKDRPADATEAIKTLPVVAKTRPAPTKPAGVRLKTGATALQTPQTITSSQAVQAPQSATTAGTATNYSGPQTSMPVAAAQAKSKKTKIIAFAGGGVALLAVIIAMVAASNDREEPAPAAPVASSETTISQADLAAMDRLPSAVADKVDVRFTTDYSIPSGEFPERATVTLNQKSALDWAVCKGLPIKNKTQRHNDGESILAIDKIGNFTPIEFPQPAQTFYFKGRSNAVPALCATSKQGDLQVGDGWLVKVKVPRDHSGTLMITTFFTSWNCSPALRITNSKGQLIDSRSIDTKGVENTATAVTTKLDGFLPGDIFFIEVTAGRAKSSKGMGISLNGVVVLK